MNKEYLLKELQMRRNQCEMIIYSIHDEEVKAQYIGEIQGINYAITIILLMEE